MGMLDPSYTSPPNRFPRIGLRCDTCDTAFDRLACQMKGIHGRHFCSKACVPAFSRTSVKCAWIGCETHLPCQRYDKMYKGKVVPMYKTEFTRKGQYAHYVFCGHHRDLIRERLGDEFRYTEGRSRVLADPDYEYDCRALSGKFVRLVIYERAGGECCRCNGALDWHAGSTQWEIDHVIPVYKGGKTCLSNLQLLCIPCHVEKTKPEKSEVGRIRWGDRNNWRPGDRRMTHTEKTHEIRDLRVEIDKLRYERAHLLAGIYGYAADHESAIQSDGEG